MTAETSLTADAPLLEVRGIDFSYGHLQILFGASLTIAQGETVTLLGTNGAGKSTLLGVISGLLAPSAGSVHFRGEDITRLRPERRVELGIVQVRGGKATFPSLTVEENLRMGAYCQWRDRARFNERMDDVVTLFPALSNLMKRPAGVLSGGEQQMMAIARALFMDPVLLMIDELSLGLAPVLMQEILKQVDEIAARGVTLLLVEQSLNIAMDVARRACFMERGRMQFDGDTNDLLERGDLLRSVFLGAAEA